MVKRQEAAARRKQFDDDESARHDADLANLVRAAQAAAGVVDGGVVPQYTELQRDPSTAVESGSGIKVSLSTRPLLSGPKLSLESRPVSTASLSGVLASASASTFSGGAGIKRGRLDVE